jgi:LysM repeat protein
MRGQKTEELNLKFIKSNMKNFFFLIPLLLLSSCVSQMMAKKDEDVSLSTLESLHELRAELAQLSHVVHGQNVDIQLLEEKVSHLSLKKRELLTETIETLQQKVDLLESTLASTRMHVEQSKKQSQHVVDTQLQRLMVLENKVAQHDTSLHIIKDVKQMLGNMQSPSKNQNYRVEIGDTLEGISRRFGLKIADLKQANRLETDQIQVGQTLKIPL